MYNKQVCKNLYRRFIPVMPRVNLEIYNTSSIFFILHETKTASFKKCTFKRFYSFSFCLFFVFLRSFSPVFTEGPPLTSQIKRVKETISNLTDVHAGVTAERSDCSQVIGLYQSGNNAILIHFSNHGGIHEIHQAILIQRNPYMREPKMKKLIICAS